MVTATDDWNAGTANACDDWGPGQSENWLGAENCSTDIETGEPDGEMFLAQSNSKEIAT